MYLAHLITRSSIISSHMNKYIVSKLNDMMKKKVSFMRGHVSEYFAYIRLN